MRRKHLILSFVLLAGLGFAWKVRADAASEMARLASLMQWQTGTVVADIGAGDGKYSFAAAQHVGATGKVYATELDRKKIEELKAEIKKRGLKNVEVVESAEAQTNLPAGCCDAIFLRRVYHHLTKPEAFDMDIARALKPGGRLAIIDFPARAGLDPVEGVPSNRGGHGIPKKIVIEELTAAGLQLEKTDDAWPEGSYCVVMKKKS
jgi:ubiquinone/menaquinone biosynthesis C-methylase UbiE